MVTVVDKGYVLGGVTGAWLAVAIHVCALWNTNKNSAKVKQPNA